MGFCCNKWNKISISINIAVKNGICLSFINSFQHNGSTNSVAFLNLHTISFSVLVMFDV
jgi:hypothetical protein